MHPVPEAALEASQQISDIYFGEVFAGGGCQLTLAN